MNLRHERGRRVRRALLPAALLLAFRAQAAFAQPAVTTPSRDLASDSLLVSLVQEALANRPEVAQAQATWKAGQARASQAGTLPDPVVSFGVQNDGFDRLRIGEMETSWWSVGAAQTIPWLGKRGLRGRAEATAARQAEADIDRVRLSTRAEVERSYVDLLLVRDQLRILERLEALWIQAEGMSRSRYETGDGAQSDLLRAQLERSRLKQQRAALVAEERRRVAALDRAAGRPLDGPLPTALSLGELQDPPLPDSARAAAEADERSPELRKARLGVEQSGALLALARREFLPDLTLSGAVMPRGGEFETMWQAGVSVPLPLWAPVKQSRGVRESRLRGEAARSGAEAVRRLLLLRVDERRAILVALLETNRIYRAGLLVQSEAAVSSAMAQYRVGRVPFASVLEALRGHLSDLDGFLLSVAAVQRIDIAQRELSLEPIAGAAPGEFGGASMPATGGMGGATAPATGPSQPPTTSSTPMRGM